MTQEAESGMAASGSGSGALTTAPAPTAGVELLGLDDLAGVVTWPDRKEFLVR